MASRWPLWLCWFVLAFGLLNFYGPSIESFRRDGDPASVSIQTLSDRTSFLDKILVDLRDDLASKLYHADAQATLGRPYQARYFLPYGSGGASSQDSRFKDDGYVESQPKMFAPQHPLLPWRDFLLEYPPGMLAAILLPSLLTSDQDAYFRIFSLEMEAFLTLAVFLSVRTADLLGAKGTRALAQSIILTAALGVIAVRRYDPTVAFAISATIYGLAARRNGLAGAAFAGAVALKGAPLVLAPVLALWFTSCRDWKGLRAASASFAACMAAVAAAYLAIAGPRALDFFEYHANRPLQMESIYGAILLIARFFAPGIMTIKYSYGSMNVVSAAGPAFAKFATAVVVLGLVASYVWAFRRIRSATDDRERFICVVIASCACLVAVISLGKVFSPQYMVLIIPIGALAGALSEGDGRWRLVVACALTQLIYPFMYTTIIAGALIPFDGLLILSRQALLWRWLFKIASDPIANSRAAPTIPPAKQAAVSAWRASLATCGGHRVNALLSGALPSFVRRPIVAAELHKDHS